ncbi:MAG: hypothetical protein JXX14_26030 [Deltaproteobacteria bacterium]|nr:hypothetical protein [Deltaproteobacteria bacterium]
MEEWQISTILTLANPIVLLSLMATAGVVLWTFMTMDPRNGWALRLGLPALRLMICLCAVYMLMQPSLIVTRSASSPTPLAVVFDTSASMGFPGDRTRLSVAIERAQKALGHNRHERTLDVQVFGFAKSVQSFDDLKSVALNADETGATSFREMISRLSRLNEDSEYAGILLFSDGADTSNITAEEVRKADMPLNVAFVGNDSKRKDLLIRDIEVDEFAFSRKPNPIQVTLENHGLPLTEVKVNLVRDGKLLQQQTATVIDGEGQATFSVLPRRTGRQIYEISVPAHPDEDSVENNTRFVELNVMRDKYRVLHLSGAPSWDQRFMRDTLTGWPQVDLVSFYLLRTTYQSTTQSNSGLSLIPFPTAELFTKHLREFDVLVFQDFDPATVGVDAYMNQISEYLADGGALIILGGAGGLSSSSIARSPLAKQLPLALPKANTPQSRLISDASFSPLLTDIGKRHPLFVTSFTDGGPEEQLRSLPRLNGMVRMKSVQSGGQVLLSHSHIKEGEVGAPLMAVSEPGRGRVLMVTTDSLWSWGFGAGMTGGPAGYYVDFWKKAVRWLTRSSELSRIALEIDSKEGNSSSPVRLNLSLLTEDYLPASGQKVSIQISWVDDNEQTRTVEFTGLTDNAGMFRKSWNAVRPGPHAVHVSADALSLSLDDSFLVKQENRELNHLSPNPTLLRELSDATGGAFFEDDVQLDDLKLKSTPESHILSRQDTALWSHPLAWLLLMGLLLGEWLFRKYRGIV